MKYILDEKGYYRKETLKEYFKGLKTHQKILLMTTHLFGFAQFLFSIYFYCLTFYSLAEIGILTDDSVQQMMQYLISDVLFFWECMILPPVVMILDIIFLKLRKFSYLVCVANIVIIFFNKWIMLAFIWNWLGN